MSVGLNRASVLAVAEEGTAGEYEAPYTGSQFVPLRPGSTLSFTSESLDSDELLNDIGSAKSFTGKTGAEGSHSAYLRHSGTEGQKPELHPFYVSMFGDYVQGGNYVTVSGSDFNTIKVADGTDFNVGQALLIKDGVNGYSIRNIKEIDGNDLILNFTLNNAPASGVATGRAILYYPYVSDTITYSVTKYLGNGHAVEATAGNATTEIALTADANGFGEVEFSFAGTKYFFNPIKIDSTNKYIDFADDAGTHAAAVGEKYYKNPIELAEALQSAMKAVSPTQDYSVKWNNQNGSFTIKSISSAVFSILWISGANAANNIGPAIGRIMAIDDTGFLEYSSNQGFTYSTPIVPEYDSADAIIIKGAELFIGNQENNLCVCAQTISMTISKEISDVDCICEETGVKEKIATARTVEMSVTAVLNKHDAMLLDALIQNKSISAMLNAGPKVGGNWSAGKCFNTFLANCTVSSYKTTGDSFIQAEITLKGFVTATEKDVYINFV
jgi:hypothetical protein